MLWDVDEVERRTRELQGIVDRAADRRPIPESWAVSITDDNVNLVQQLLLPQAPENRSFRVNDRFLDQLGWDEKEALGAFLAIQPILNGISVAHTRNVQEAEVAIKTLFGVGCGGALGATEGYVRSRDYADPKTRREIIRTWLLGSAALGLSAGMFYGLEVQDSETNMARIRLRIELTLAEQALSVHPDPSAHLRLWSKIAEEQQRVDPTNANAIDFATRMADLFMIMRDNPQPERGSSSQHVR